MAFGHALDECRRHAPDWRAQRGGGLLPWCRPFSFSVGAVREAALFLPEEEVETEEARGAPTPVSAA